jgi:hypothetical protein
MKRRRDLAPALLDHLTLALFSTLSGACAHRVASRGGLELRDAVIRRITFCVSCNQASSPDYFLFQSQRARGAGDRPTERSLIANPAASIQGTIVERCEARAQRT